ncbi:hypothetical protein LCGC14_0957770 [marine sediment metagenome]|uniref:Uncharacterized protein n=1 Tax=marine sediment metagenome TaxID=412755 RepID=A0A0F9NJZ9_9ZZZZ
MVGGVKNINIINKREVNKNEKNEFKKKNKEI